MADLDLWLSDAVQNPDSSTKYAPGRKGASSIYKRTFDIAFSSTALVLLIPIIIMVCGLLLVSQGRPLLIKHDRLGWRGKPFPCLKFRTMVKNAGTVLENHLCLDPSARAEWEATRKLKEDPRVTSFGRVLRRTSLDEIPQLINILRGQMSLVGPRPIVSDERTYYGENIDAYLSVRPGLTGLWQINGRNDISYAERVRLDTYYVSTLSPMNDLKIIVRTIPAVFRSVGSY